MRIVRALVMVVAFTPIGAQTQAQVTVDPGMTQAQVVQRLGQPLSSRSYGAFTYLLYKNGCEQTCGMNDLVVLDSGKVVDAIFRSPARRYTGHSSSPKMIPAADARRESDKPAAAKAPPAKPAVAKAPPAKPPAAKPAPAKPTDAKSPPVKPADPKAAVPPKKPLP